MADLLGVLSREGIVKLECVAHDGPKIQAQAGNDGAVSGPGGSGWRIHQSSFDYGDEPEPDGFLWIAGGSGSEAGSFDESGGNRSGVWAECVSSSGREQDLAVPGGKDLGVREAVQERRHDVLAVSGRRPGLQRMWLSKTVLSSTGTRAAGIHPHDGECGGRGVPKEDEDRGGAGHLQEAGTGGGVSQCLDQGEVRDSEIPAAGDGQGEHGSTVGSVHLQRAAMDPIELAAEADGWRKDSHGDGIAKAGKRAKLGLEGERARKWCHVKEIGR